MSSVHIPRRLSAAFWGGTERVLAETLPYLPEEQYQPRIFTTNALGGEEFDQLDTVPIRRFDYLYPEWPLSRERHRQYDLCGGNLVSFSLAQELSKTPNLKIVHCHTGNRLGAQCLRAARKRKVPCLLTLHGGYFDIPQEHAEKQKGIPKEISLPWGKVLSAIWQTPQLVADVDALICVGLQEYEKAKAALPDQRVEYLPGGVDLEQFRYPSSNQHRANLGIREDEVVVLCVARLDHQKDQATLIQAIHQIEPLPHLLLVGPETSAGYRDELHRLVENLGLHSNIHFLGGVQPADIPSFYQAADIAVLPSLHEPFGLGLIEAWASETPIICSNRGFPGWVLQKQEEGLLFEPGQFIQLRQCIQQLIQSESRALELVTAGARKARQFTWRARAKRLTAIYDELIEREENQKHAA
ncbi:MAG: glycosyltransferase family 4 protein [Polyangiaceae bacterium]|nr:glycosyltransferase family 4 protein [Polyangiaceae bacterium]